MQESGMHDRASLHEFARIGEVAETTTQLLALGLQHHTTFAGRPRGTARKIDPVEQYVLQQGDLMARVREGFVLSVRSAQALSKAELRFLLERVLHDWGALSEELGLQPLQAEPSSSAEQGAAQASERQRFGATAHGITWPSAWRLAPGGSAAHAGRRSRLPLQLWQAAHLR